MEKKVRGICQSEKAKDTEITVLPWEKLSKLWTFFNMPHVHVDLCYIDVYTMQTLILYLLAIRSYILTF